MQTSQTTVLLIDAGEVVELLVDMEYSKKGGKLDRRPDANRQYFTLGRSIANHTYFIFPRRTPFSVSIQVLVTGYGGFLGKAICRRLLQQGHSVRGIARGLYPDMATLGVVCLRASITDESACDRVCRGVQAIIHTAALAGVWGKAADFEQANVQSTDSLLKAALKNGVQTFVYTSSPSVTFDGSPQRNMDESAPYPARWLCHYPRTKAIAERHALDSNSSQLATCALRPHLIWGPGDPHLIPRVIERCRQGRLMRVGDGKNLIDTVHVDAAAEAHCLALERLIDRDPSVEGRPFFITDGQPIECWQWITEILKLAKLSPPSGSISLANAYRIGAILEGLYTVLRRRTEPPMTRFVAKQLGVDHYFNIESAKTRLGYKPITNRTELMQQITIQ
jgi:nucleoside-diphosphate-sugar epimerase